MNQRITTLILTFISILFFVSSIEASPDSYFVYINKKEAKPNSNYYHFGYWKGLEVKISPERPEFTAGSIATFTISLTNRNKYTTVVEYPNGREWDLVIFHGWSQIFRWSDGFTWQNSSHSIVLKPGESISHQLSWVSVNKFGQTLPQGVYRCVGLVTCYPKTIISKEVKFRLTPPSVVAKEIIKTNLNQCFEIELPRFGNESELKWKIVYVNNDNRISITSRRIKDESIVITFLPKRLGHVEFDMYAYPELLNSSVSLERRSYRIEVE